MRRIIVFYLMLFPFVVNAAPKLYLGMAADNSAALWLDQRKIEGKLVHIIGYKSDKKNEFEIALPPTEYKRLETEMKKWMSGKVERNVAMTGPDCAAAIYFEIDKKSKHVCFDGVSKQEKVKFARWYNKTVRMVLGLY